MTDTTMTVDLSNKVAIVTGSSRGIGVHYAKVLAANGAHVIITGRPGAEEKLEKVVSHISKSGGSSSYITLDLQDISSFPSKVNSIIANYKKIDILINNAGAAADKNIFDIDEKNWDLHLNTNLKGTFFLSQCVANHMKNQKGMSSIVNIAAINGQKVRKNCIPFGVSKAGIIQMTKAMAYELIDYGIKVNAISLGSFPSESVARYLKTDPSAKDYLNRIPAKRPGDFSDLDGPLLLLASDASNYMYGSVVEVDGGFSSNVFMDVELELVS